MSDAYATLNCGFCGRLHDGFPRGWKWDGFMGLWVCDAEACREQASDIRRSVGESSE